jgi:hypothetical protein
MDAESQFTEKLKAEVRQLEEKLAARNQIIGELLDWIDGELRLDTYPPNSPGRQLWDRAQEAIK